MASILRLVPPRTERGRGREHGPSAAAAANFPSFAQPARPGSRPVRCTTLKRNPTTREAGQGTDPSHVTRTRHRFEIVPTSLPQPPSHVRPPPVAVALTPSEQHGLFLRTARPPLPPTLGWQRDVTDDCSSPPPVRFGNGGEQDDSQQAQQNADVYNGDDSNKSSWTHELIGGMTCPPLFP